MMSDAVTIDLYTFVVLLISVFVLGVFVGIVATPFMQGPALPPRIRRAPNGFETVTTTTTTVEETELSPAERHWVKRGPAGGS